MAKDFREKLKGGIRADDVDVADFGLVDSNDEHIDHDFDAHDDDVAMVMVMVMAMAVMLAMVMVVMAITNGDVSDGDVVDAHIHTYIHV